MIMVRLFRAECYEGKQANRSSEIRFKSGGKISKMEAEAKNQEQETDDEGENMREQVEAIENDLAAAKGAISLNRDEGGWERSAQER